jgi:cytochrome bd ubiquinol oxidase subunit II
MAEVCLALAVAGLVAYAVLGGADYGSGFWDLTAGGPERGGPVRGLAVASMSPVWEANHVWLPFVLVILWTAFPVFFASFMSTLWIPLLLATAGIIFRGTAFVLRGHARTVREGQALGGLFALSSLLVPFSLGAVIGAVASGRVPVGNAEGEPFGSWLNPTSIALGIVGVAAGAHLAAVFMAGDAQQRGLDHLVEPMRRRALASGAVTGALALASLVVVRGDARPLFDGLTSGFGLVCVLVSGLAGVATLGLVAVRRLEPARFAAAGSVTFVVIGWVAAQSPYLLPGHLSLDAAAANDATLTAVVVAFAVGAVLLVPSLVLLYRLVLRGVVQSPYKPLDEGLER